MTKSVEQQAAELVAKFTKKSIDIDSAVGRGLETCGKIIQTNAQQLVNKDTGLLVNSIAIRQTKTLTSQTVEVGSNVEYAADQEFLPEPRGKPYLTPALNSNKARYEPLIAASMKVVI